MRMRGAALTTHTPSNAEPALVLAIGDAPVVQQAGADLAPSGVTTISAATGREAMDRFDALEPDLVVVHAATAAEPDGGVTDARFVRELHARGGAQLPVVVIGEPEDDDPPAGAYEVLPADVGVPELVDRIRSRLTAPAGRPAVEVAHLLRESQRERRRAALTGRPGVLATVSVAELAQVRAQFGVQAERALAAAFDELFHRDEQILEQHAFDPRSGFWLLMPETNAVAARARLQLISRRIAGMVLDIAGEHVRLTPVIGYATFSESASGRDLREQATVALRDAELHLDLVPVRFAPAMREVAIAAPTRDRVLALVERMRSPLQIVFTFACLLSLPFLVYVAFWAIGVDLTVVTYPIVAFALVGTAALLWVESLLAARPTRPPGRPTTTPPQATAIVAAYLPNEAATIVDTLLTMLAHDYAGGLQVILAYNTPQTLPVEDVLAEIAERDPRLLLLRVEASSSKAQNVNAALRHVTGEFVGVFDADHHPAPGSFARAWRWLSHGHDVVQGHCVVRNGEASWVARLVAVEFETIYAVGHPGRARLHGFGIFGGSNGYWRREALQQIRMQRSMLTEDIDSSMRALREGLVIASDRGLVSTELAPTSLDALWHQRMRWAQGWTQTSRRHLGPSLVSDRMSLRQKAGVSFLLGWAQVVPWITIQVIPILGFAVWRDRGLSHLDWLVPLFVAMTVFTLSVGIVQVVLAYPLSDGETRAHRRWFVLYAINSTLWFGEFKNLIARVAQLKEIIGEHHWRVTPRAAEPLVSTGSGGRFGDEGGPHELR